jgi:hypothetical protein
VSPVAFVTRVGAASGARAAAAALACAGSEPDRAGLLIDLADGRAPRPSLLATAAARDLEERLAAHMPEAGVASRGSTCHLKLPAGADGIERIPAALPLARGSVAVVHLPPALLQPALAESRIGPTAALLRADLDRDRALTSLAVRDLIARGLRVAVLKRPLSWLTARRALLGAAGAGSGGIPPRFHRLLSGADGIASHSCYGSAHGPEADSARTSEQERRDHASARRGRGVHRHPQRGSGR